MDCPDVQMTKKRMAAVVMAAAAAAGLLVWLSAGRKTEENSEPLGEIAADLSGEEEEGIEPEEETVEDAPAETPGVYEITGEELETDDLSGVSFVRRSLPAWGISISLPAGWEVDDSRPNYIRVRCPEDAVYGASELVLAMQSVASRNPEKLIDQTYRFIEENIRYTTYDGQTLYGSAFFSAGQNASVNRIQASASPVWVNGNRLDAYQEYDEIPENGGTGWEQVQPFANVTEYGTSMFTDTMGTGVDVHYSFTHTLYDYTVLSVGWLSADSLTSPIERVAGVTASSAEKLEDNSPAADTSGTSQARIGGITLSLPSVFEGSTAVRTGLWRCRDMDAAEYGMGIAALCLPDTPQSGVDGDTPGLLEAALMQSGSVLSSAEITAQRSNIACVLSDGSFLNKGDGGRLREMIIDLSGCSQTKRAKLGGMTTVRAKTAVFEHDGNTYFLAVTYGKSNEKLAAQVLSRLAAEAELL